MIKKIIRIFFTLIYLKPYQLFYFILRRGFPYSNVSLPKFQRLTNNQLSLLSPIITNCHDHEKNSFSFLNRTVFFDIKKINWSPKNEKRLWKYNLHYFDYLRDPFWSVDQKYQFIIDWIENNPQSSKPGWEPFTCSLRLVNWIFYINLNNFQYDKSILESIYLQALWLEKNDERHILANHYFENLKALLFAGCFFKGEDSDRWLQRALIEISQQLEEQTLQDGGHFERSPQYHALMLENYLDIYNLAISNKKLMNDEFIQKLKKYITNGLDFLNSIVFPDNRIPLFNDSAFNIAPSVESLNEYAKILFSYKRPNETSPIYIIEKPDSGFFGFKSDIDMLIMTCGEIVPAYQPGHTHCDLLSFELMMSSKRIIIDSGVYEYEPGELRNYARSTRAHNTISVNEDEQSEIWGEFRIARRSRKHFSYIEKHNDNIFITGKYSGFYGDNFCINPKFTHNRSINVKLVKDTIDSIDVIDKITGNGENLVESFIHFHPDFKIINNHDGTLIIKNNNSDFALLNIDEKYQFRIEKGLYCPEFGIKYEIDCLVIFAKNILPFEISYQLKKI